MKNHAKWKAKTAKIPDFGDGVLLAEPTTFMNLSGWAVRALATFHKLAPDDLLIVYDDADLPLGRLRLRPSGSAGGHNGLKSIIQELGTSEIPRLRVGVGGQDGELKTTCSAVSIPTKSRRSMRQCNERRTRRRCS